MFSMQLALSGPLCRLQPCCCSSSLLLLIKFLANCLVLSPTLATLTLECFSAEKSVYLQRISLFNVNRCIHCLWWFYSLPECPFGMLFESFSEDFICSHPIINNNGDVLYCVNLWEMCLDVVARSPHRCEDAVYYISNKSSPFSLSVHYYDMTWHVAP